MEIQNLGSDDILDVLSIILFSSPFFLGNRVTRALFYETNYVEWYIISLTFSSVDSF